jgi:hypothetical protein
LLFRKTIKLILLNKAIYFIMQKQLYCL